MKILTIAKTPPWWDSLTREGQKEYIDQHPGSDLKHYMKSGSPAKSKPEPKPEPKQTGIEGIHSASDLLKKFGKNVSSEEILNQIPEEDQQEFHDYEKKLKEQIDAGKETYLQHTVNGEYTEERKKKHDEIMNRVFASADNYRPREGKKPKMIILGGRGGSGKSSFDCAVKPEICVYDKEHYLVLDADWFKEQFKDEGYDGWNAYLFHEESSYLFKLAMAQAKDRGLNVVLDVTMGSSMAKRVKSFQDSGYSVEAHYMFLPPQKAAARALSRWESKGKGHRGRLVPPDVILKMTSNESNFDEIKDLVDAYSVFSNDVPKGENPIPIASGSKQMETSSFRSTGMKIAYAAATQRLRITAMKPDPRKFDNDPMPFGKHTLNQKFESYKRQGLKPNDMFSTKQANEYRQWLAKNK